MSERNSTGLAWSAEDDPDSDQEIAPVDDLLMPGEVIGGRYEIVDILGEGGFGVVYRAYQREMARDVAIKTLRRGIVDYDEAAARFRREALLARHLTHPHTIRLFDFGQTEGGILYICMEYLEGETLEERVFDRGSVPLDKTLELGKQIAESLWEAHQNGIIHRDMKPSNVFLGEVGGQKDFVKVLDFGIAKITQPWAEDPEQNNKLTRTGTAFGSPAYMSPEQVRGTTITPAADVYGWGLIILETLTGEQVVDGNSPFDVALKQASPDPIQIPAWVADSPLGDIIERALEKEVEARYADAGELLEALEAISDEDVDAYMTRMTEEIAFEDLLEEAYAAEVEVSDSEKKALARRRNRLALVGLAVTSVVIAVVAVTLLLWQRSEPSGASDAPDEATTDRSTAEDAAGRSLFLSSVVGRSARSTVSGAVAEQILPRRPLGVTAERIPLPLPSRSSPMTPLIALSNGYRAVAEMPAVSHLTEDARVTIEHPIGLQLVNATIISSFAGGSELKRVQLKFRSVPRGATVFREGESGAPLGQSPLELEVVQSPRQLTYRFEAWGYQPVELDVSHRENTTTTAHMRKRIRAKDTLTVPD